MPSKDIFNHNTISSYQSILLSLQKDPSDNMKVILYRIKL